MFQFNISRPLATYLIAIHLVLGAIAYAAYLKPTEDQWHNRLHAFYQRVDANVEPGAYLFLGDSHVQGLCSNCVIDQAMNYGIGKDTLAGVNRRLLDYHSRHHAIAITP